MKTQSHRESLWHVICYLVCILIQQPRIPMQPITTMRVVPAILLVLACGSISVADQPDSIALFDAIDAGQVEVKFIPADETKANVLIKNKTADALQIQLPEAIAAVPVLAQFAQQQGFGQGLGQGFGQGAGQGFGQGVGQNGGGGASQGLGGAFNGGGGQGNRLGNGFGRPGFMRIAPEKTRKLTATTVCLEHGKPEPHPRIAYRMIPLSEFSDDPRVAKLCRDLGCGSIDQPAAQAIAWHLENGLTWEKLAGINRIRSRYLGNIKFFRPSQLARAKQWLEETDSDQTSGNSYPPPIAARDYSSTATFN
jgi:hypothetical protein